MKIKHFIKLVIISFFLTTILSGCPSPLRMPVWPPNKPDGFMSAKWGISPEECKKAIENDHNRCFKDNTSEAPFALYASGSYIGSSAIFSYFFTPKSKRLFRVDVTLDDIGIYERVKNNLIEKFKIPSFSLKDVDHWFWEDKSLVILQRNDKNVQISYSSGPLLEVNRDERK